MYHIHKKLDLPHVSYTRSFRSTICVTYTIIYFQSKIYSMHVKNRCGSNATWRIFRWFACKFSSHEMKQQKINIKIVLILKSCLDLIKKSSKDWLTCHETKFWIWKKQGIKISYLNRYPSSSSDRILRMFKISDVAAQTSNLCWYPYGDDLIRALRPSEY